MPTADAPGLSWAAQQLRMNGIAVLGDDLLPRAKVEAIREHFLERLERYAAANPQNRGANRFYMDIPFEPPFDDPEVYANPQVLSVVREIIGLDIYLGIYGSDTPLPGSDYQAVHQDVPLLFPELPLAHPPQMIIANLILVDVTEENGPMEFWPGGTHYMPSKMEMGKLAAEMPPMRLLPKAGTFLVRDPRAWHRGTPNRSTQPRPTISFCYMRSWYRHEMPTPRIERSRYEQLSPEDQKLFRFSHR